jgi:hypothetical protein
MPVNAWHLFPVREKIVTVKETNWTVTIGITFLTLIISFLAIIKSKKLNNREIQIQCAQTAKKCEDAVNREFNDAGLHLVIYPDGTDKIYLLHMCKYWNIVGFIHKNCLKAMARKADKFNRKHGNPEDSNPSILERAIKEQAQIAIITAERRRQADLELKYIQEYEEAERARALAKNDDVDETETASSKTNTSDEDDK